MEEMLRVERKGGKFICPDDGMAETILRMGFGSRQDGGTRLHPLEAAYLAERGKAEIFDGGKKIGALALLKQKQIGKSVVSLPDQYEIFKALRQGGRVVRFTPSSPLHWRVYARGVGREQDRPSTLMIVVGKSWKASLSTIEPMLATARLLRLELSIAYLKEGKPNIIKISKSAIEV
jgi:tRNA splicing endonuclease